MLLVIFEFHIRMLFCFKSHNLPDPDYRKVIYIVRDGRDVLVSYHHFQESMGSDRSSYESLLSGQGLPFGRWHEHVNVWVSNPFNIELLFVRY